MNGVPSVFLAFVDRGEDVAPAVYKNNVYQGTEDQLDIVEDLIAPHNGSRFFVTFLTITGSWNGVPPANLGDVEVEEL